MNQQHEFVGFACECGSVQGRAKKLETLRGRRFVCMCDDCQTCYGTDCENPRRFFDPGTDQPQAPLDVLSASERERLRGLTIQNHGQNQTSLTALHFGFIFNLPVN